MRKINKDELIRYFELATSRGEKPDNYDSEEDLLLLRNALLGTGFVGILVDTMNMLRARGSDKEAAGSMWMTGFQMGREFELRNNEERELMRSVGEPPPAEDPQPVRVSYLSKKLDLEDSDVLICALKETIDAPSEARLVELNKDNLVGTCSCCHRAVVYRPTAPVGPIKMCTECVMKMRYSVSADSAGEVN